MLGFILSKLNLLILVVAVFAIVSFFSIGLVDLVKIHESRQLLERVSQKAYALVNSPTYCFSDSFDLPRQIRVAGEDFYYVMKISVQKVLKNQGLPDEQQISVVIFSIHPRIEYLRFLRGDLRSEPPSVAASSFRVPATVSLYSPAYSEEGRYQIGADAIELCTGENCIPDAGSSTTEGASLLVDPNAQIPFNNVEFLKEIRSGELFVHIFPCSTNTTSNDALCEQAKQDVSVKACNEAKLNLVNRAGEAIFRGECPSGSSGAIPSGGTTGQDVWFNC